MTDIVNAFFRHFYPPDWNSNWRMIAYSSLGVMREYRGDRKKWPNIFPRIVCADGFAMSVQGHFGAYSHPRDDFAESYSAVEILGPKCHAFGREGHECNDEWLYGYVPIAVVEAVIAAHGGLIDMEPSK